MEKPRVEADLRHYDGLTGGGDLAGDPSPKL
jgi:hypothetical protein